MGSRFSNYPQTRAPHEENLAFALLHPAGAHLINQAVAAAAELDDRLKVDLHPGPALRANGRNSGIVLFHEANGLHIGRSKLDPIFAAAHLFLPLARPLLARAPQLWLLQVDRQTRERRVGLRARGSVVVEAGGQRLSHDLDGDLALRPIRMDQPGGCCWCHGGEGRIDLIGENLMGMAHGQKRTEQELIVNAPRLRARD